MNMKLSQIALTLAACLVVVPMQAYSAPPSQLPPPQSVEKALSEIQATLAQIQAAVDALGSGGASLPNTLDLQVGVAFSYSDIFSDTPVQVFVRVTQNGVLVTGLTAANFDWHTSFPLNGASYCGPACFREGENGLYDIELQGDWGAEPYAGILNVHSTTTTPDGDVTANGTALVTFEPRAVPVP